MRALGLGPGLGGKRIVVQGLGNVGSHAARFLRDAGALIIAIAEREGAIHATDGLDVEAVIEHREATGSLLGYAQASFMKSSAAALEVDCDILVPAALEGQVTALNAPNIRARILGEAANGPTTAAAQKILESRGVLVLADIYLNAGGVVVSYFEWVKNLSHVRLGRLTPGFSATRVLGALEPGSIGTVGEEESGVPIRDGASATELNLVRSGLQETISSALHTIQAAHMTRRTRNLRVAAMLVAIDRVALSYREMGIFP
jgi:glutamate dehydrogenase (NAD(P)+)